MKRAILALSGGLDSTSLLLHLLHNKYEVRCYLFNYGQKHVFELERAQKNIDYLFQFFGYSVFCKVIDLKSVFEESGSALINKDVKVPEGHYEQVNMKDTVVENRNAIFAAILYSKALGWANQIKDKVEICLGIHKGDHAIYPDCRKESRDALAEAFRVSNWGSENIDYYTPFLDYDKFGILKEASNICDTEMIDFERIFENTNTCYQPSILGYACGKCGSCVERVQAFLLLGQPDPVCYMNGWEETVNSVRETLSKQDKK